ncbi:hypothetical protein B5K05_04005 [Rhizobium phaseoli]|uniref:helix-turn-helix domain-containing protein n=1 Tax=Rhizobium phaseoli TaxID=396 RepID=UPI000E0D1DC1|nr:helix-turn-helix transcriptional regulator [Rhizobium phaseoli]RDJ17245.1 hypothetical protein B5K04_03985 [Rhizobium phaseoli]RDJ18838.1 hypothetical protein B5K05_04005 [Rhizobium phaseoli]
MASKIRTKHRIFYKRSMCTHIPLSAGFANVWRMTSGKQIGSLVRQLRKAQGMTQTELAEAIGRTMDAVSMIERGNSVPSVETLIALSKALNASIETLLLPEDAQITPARRDKISQGYAVLASLPDDKLLIAVDQLRALARSS